MRLHSSAGPATLAGDLCPGCGSLLEPVGQLAEIVGFQSIEHRDLVADDGSPGTPRRVADRLDALFAHRAATVTQTPREAESQLDHGGRVMPDGLSEEVALAAPDETP
jgi:hypothetical protein